MPRIQFWKYAGREKPNRIQSIPNRIKKSGAKNRISTIAADGSINKIVVAMFIKERRRLLENMFLSVLSNLARSGKKYGRMKRHRIPIPQRTMLINIFPGKDKGNNMRASINRQTATRIINNHAIVA